MVKSAQGAPSGESPTTWNKRRKAEDHMPDNAGPAAKKPRTRVSYSCGECHRRKQKCDRQVPCSHCLARKVPELCKAYTPGKTDQDLPARVARLESIIESAFPHLSGFSTPHGGLGDYHGAGEPSRSNSLGPDDDSGSQQDENDTAAGRFMDGRWFGENVSGSVAPARVLEQLQHVVAPVAKNSPRSDNSLPHSTILSAEDSGPSDAFPPEGDNPMVTRPLEPSAADNLERLMRDCGVSQSLLTEIMQVNELPPRQFSDALVDYYFSSINWTRYPISEPDFRSAYASICANGVSVTTTLNDVRFLPLLFVVLAIAVRLAPDRIAGTAENKRQLSVRYFWSSRRALLIASAVQPDSLEMVLIRLMSARFLTFDRRITECWSQLGAAVRTAQALGLHRDGAALGMEPKQVEYRRRIWSYLLHADRSYAMVLGRPSAIQDDYFSTLPPSNIDDDSSTPQIRNPPSLSTTPTPMSFVILRHQLAGIIGRMVHHFQQLRVKPRYADVLNLDDELMRFVGNLPLHFAMDPDTSLDSKHSFLPVHRYLFITEVLFVRISLHRPYLLRQLDSDRYLRSRRACFESALKDFQVRQSFRESVSADDHRAYSNAYREFQTAMISGIYLVLEPDGKDAAAMHTILDTFIAEHRDLPDMDTTTRRELKIVEFLREKAQEHGAQEGSPISPTTRAAGDAHLLLSLHQPQSRPTGDTQRQSSRNGFLPLALSPSAVTSKATSALSSPPLSFAQATQHSLTHPYRPVGSPASDEESAAQSLLDHWCNTVSGAMSDGPAGTPGGPGAYLGSSDYLSWLGPGPTQLGAETSVFAGLEGQDWNYWETLVNQIRSGPVP